MPFFTRCTGCKKVRFHTAHRKMKTVQMGAVTSKDEICRECFNKLKKLVTLQ